MGQEIVNYTHGRLVDPQTLIPHPDNPNHHPAGQISALCEVIRENGWRNAIVVSKRSGYVIKGHGRLLAAKRMMCLVPVEYQDYANEEAEVRDLVADNKIAELSMLDAGKIAELRRKFKGAAEGWGDVKTSGALMQAQFSELKKKSPSKSKYPILILESEEQFRMFESIKQRLGTKSDAAAFGKILTQAYACAETTEEEER